MSANEIKPMESAFASFEWMGRDKLQGAVVDGRNLIDLVNRAQDVALGVKAVMELAAAHSSAENAGEDPYLNGFMIGCLERLAIRALDDLSGHAEEIAKGQHESEHLGE
ncbi:MAG: hypothetical protein ACK4F6_16895 [Hylemonella sp.]